MASYDELSKDILKDIGGKDNINSVIHCATRLRFKLKDEDKAQDDAIKDLNGVVTVVKSGGQYQVVIGNQVADVYDSLVNVGHLENSSDDETDDSGKKGSIVDIFIDLVSNIFAPILGVMASSGMIKGLASLFVALGWMKVTSGTYTILYAIGDSFFYFLPILLGYTSAKKFKVDQFVGMALGAVMTYPTIVALNASKTTLFTLFKGTTFASPVHATFLGIPVVTMNYTSTVIPIIVAMWFASYVQKGAKKVIPDVMKSFFVPFFVLLIVIPVTFLVIGPVTTWLSNLILLGLQFLYNASPIVAGIVMGSVWQVLVIFGLHWGVVAVSLANMAKNGFDPFLALITGASFAQTGVVLAMLLQSKDKKMRSIGIPAFISGLFGITEPAIYGMTLPRKRPFIYSCIAAGISGGMIGFYGTKQFIMGGFGIFSLPSFISAKTGLNTAFYGMIISIIVAFVLGFAIQYFLGRKFVDVENNAVATVDNTVKTDSENSADTTLSAETIDSPLDGELVKLEDVDDPVFSTKSMGNGVAINPSKGILYAPVDGKVSLVFPTGHAIGINSENGSEILMHIGMDTVQLDGKGFNVLVEKDQEVKKGQELVKFDMDFIKSKGYELTTPIIVTNTNLYDSVNVLEDNGPIYHGENLINTNTK